MPISDPPGYFVPPDYSPSSPSPTYSKSPSSSEERLDYIPTRRCSLPLSSWSRKHRGVEITLYGQEESISIPTYGRNGMIQGNLTFTNSDAFSDVSLVLEGYANMAIAQGGGTNQLLVRQTHSLWTRNASSEVSCPSSLLFSIQFPITMIDGDRNRPLPPSYSCILPGVPGLCVKCFYSLTIVIKSKRSISSWFSEKCISVPLAYFPRSCPPLPIPRNIFPFFSTIKAQPESWTQVTSTISTRAASHLQPIDCHLFIPSVQIFAISDTIPFFLQFRAPAASLKNLVSFPSPKLSSNAPSSMAKPVIRVFLYRQIRAEIGGQKTWGNVELGEGKLTPLTSTEEFLSRPVSSDDSVENLEWEGEVRCNHVTVGGFSVDHLAVKDFIVLKLIPQNPDKSPLLEHQSAHPIRLVTDEYSDRS